MGNLIEMKLGNQEKILIESSEGNIPVTRSGIKKGVIDLTDQIFDVVIQKQIIGFCNVLSNSFNKLSKDKPTPKKANVEFGLQLNGEGNIYITKISAESSFKISFEWNLD